MGGRARERGASAVEFALVLPLFLLLIGGITDFGRAYYTQVVMTNAAREGGRAAMTPSTSNQSSVSTRALQAISASPPANYSVTLSKSCPTTTTTPPTTTTVTVTYSNFDWMVLGPALKILGFANNLPTTLSGRATMQCGG